MSNVPRALEPTGYRLLTVDDDLSTLEYLRVTLERGGYEVWSASSGREALEILEIRGLPHLALVDVKMPEMTGIELCARIHEFIDLPIIAVTSVSDQRTVVDMINRLVEDYVIKPFEPAELVARISRLLRRIGDFSYTLAPQMRVDRHLVIEFGRRLAIVGGEEVELTPIETKLLHILMRNAGRPMSTEYLLGRIWPFDQAFEDTLRTHVYRLRKKIEPTPRKPRYVVTSRGYGYEFPKPG